MTGRRAVDEGASRAVVRVVAGEGTADATAAPHLAPLVQLLGEIRGLRGLRDCGQISAVEYERRRDRLIERI
jgi:hypothetical protein